MSGRQGAIQLSIAGGVAALLGIGWMGTQVPAKAAPPAELPGRDLDAVPLPAGLPPPVEKFYRITMGDKLPRAETMVMWGTATMKLGTRWNARFRVYHVAGQHFMRYIDITWFGLPVAHGKDEYVNGRGATTMPGNSPMTGAEIDQGSNHILWAEGVFMPSLLVTDPRVRWESVDANTARLDVPFGNQRDQLTFGFDPQTGLLDHVRTKRYKKVGVEKEPWRCDFRNWHTNPNGTMLPTQIAIHWEKERSPWSYWNIQGVAWNVDVTKHIAA